jgi:tetratricopeptide (TPR) repeat protein
MTTTDADDRWLKEDNPDLFLIVHALAGDADALARLEREGRGLALFTLALAGNKKALAALDKGGDLELDYVHGLAVNCRQGGWLLERHPELYAVFEAVKGDEGPLRRLKGKKPGLTKLARLVRAAKLDDGERTGGESGDGPADIGCLVGEMHLGRGEFARAVEAFTRAIAVAPTPDALEGRARAYRGLAALDERRAREVERA